MPRPFENCPCVLNVVGAQRACYQRDSVGGRVKSPRILEIGPCSCDDGRKGDVTVGYADRMFDLGKELRFLSPIATFEEGDKVFGVKALILALKLYLSDWPGLRAGNDASR